MLRTLTPLSKRGVSPAGRCLLTLVKPQSELSFTESRSSLPDICSCLCPSSHLPLQKVGTSGVVCLMRITDPCVHGVNTGRKFEDVSTSPSYPHGELELQVKAPDV
jgi:hypothetical protein